ncbi:MAG: hypothetical protein R3A44_03875 [Caldilineaceae bacterium]
MNKTKKAQAKDLVVEYLAKNDKELRRTRHAADASLALIMKINPLPQHRKAITKQA